MTPPGRVTGARAYTDWRGNAGLLLGALTMLSWTVSRALEDILVTNRLTATFALADIITTGVDEGHVLALLYDHGGTATVEEFRIVRKTANLRTGTVSFDAEGPEIELGRALLPLFDRIGPLASFDLHDDNVAPLDELTNRILPALPAYWGIGTVTPLIAVSVALSAATPLEAALALGKASNEAEGIASEFYVTQSASGFLLNFGVYNGAEVRADLRPGKNLINAGLVRDGSRKTSRAFFATPNALQRPHYMITATDPDAIYVMDLSTLDLGVTRRGPARENGQFEGQVGGAQLVEVKNGVAHAILATTRVSYTTTKFTVASTTGIAFKDVCYLTDGAGNDFAVFDSPVLLATEGVRLSPALLGDDPQTNLLLGPDFGGGGAGTPNFWNLLPGSGAVVYSTTPGTFRNGGRSAVLRLTGVGPVVHFNQASVIHCLAGEIYTYTVWFQVATVGHAGNKIVVYDPNTGLGRTLTIDGAAPFAELGVWYSWSTSFTIATTGNKTFQVELIGDNSTPTGIAYVDAAQLIRASAEQPYRRGSGAVANLNQANALFDETGLAAETFTIDPADLEYLAGAGPDPLQVGATLYLTASGLNVTRRPLRVVGEERSSSAPANPRLTVTTQLRKLTTFLTGLV